MHCIFFFSQFQLITAKTNRYAKVKVATSPDPNWKETTVDEIAAYLGLYVYMSIVAMPSYDLYWGTDPMFRGQFASKVMNRNRFDKLSQYFHLADTSTNPPRGQSSHNKLAHVQPVLDELRENCL